MKTKKTIISSIRFLFFCLIIISTQHKIFAQSPAELSQEWIKQYGSESSSPSQTPFGMISDHNGNSYILFSTGTTFNSEDFLLIKYDQSGNKVWTQKYDGPDHFTDVPKSLIVDTHNNIYVTGTSYNYENKSVLTTIKYNEAGEQQWVNRFENPNEGNVEARGITISRTGLIFVIADIAERNYATEDFLSLRLDDYGNVLWWKRYDSGRVDDPKCWAVDKDDNLIICGISNDYTGIVKYSKDGEQLWVQHYHSIIDKYIQNMSIGSDLEGNIYVVSPEGNSYNYTNFYISKYTSEGILAWNKKYAASASGLSDHYNCDDYLAGAKIDDRGTVTMIGSYFVANSNERNLAFYKIDNNGNSLIEKLHKYNTSVGYDRPRLMMTDKDGNYFVYSDSVTNYNHINGITKYDSLGNRIWRTTEVGYNPNGISVSDDGNTHTFCIYDKDSKRYNLISTYDSLGKCLWSKKVSDTSSTSQETPIGVTSANGNIYVTASSDGSLKGTGLDALSIGYNKQGEQLWTDRYDHGNPINIVADKAGYLYVIGQNGNILKYSPNGELLWENKYSSNYSYSFSIIKLDNSGNVYCAGYSSFDRGRFLIVKFSNDGNFLLDIFQVIDWTDFPTLCDFTVDDNGNMYITGTTHKAKIEGDPNTYSQMVTIKYNSSGIIEWTRFYGEGKFNSGYRITIDYNSNVFVCGRSDNSIITIMYDLNGNQKWKNIIGGSYPTLVGIGLDQSGNPAIGGSGSINGVGKYFAIKYDQNGNELWFASYAFENIGQSFISSTAADMKIDTLGNIYLIGTSSSSVCTLLKISSNGGIAWTAKYRNGTSIDHGPWSEGKSITLDNDGNVYAVAKTTVYSNNAGSSFITIMKYTQTLVGVNKSEVIPNEYKLSQNYPNPFNPSTTIQYTIPVETTRRVVFTTLKIYDVLGREVSTLVNETKQPGNYEVKFDGASLPSGVYFYKLQAGDFVQTKKLMLIK